MPRTTRQNNETDRAYMERRTGRGGARRREVMQYIVDHADRYGGANSTRVQQAQRYLDNHVSEVEQSPTQSRAKERNSRQRSDARNRRRPGMNSANTRNVVERSAGVTSMNRTDADFLRSRADAWAAFGWGK